MSALPCRSLMQSSSDSVHVFRVPLLPQASDPFAQLSAPGPPPAQQPGGDPFAGAFSATSSTPGHSAAASPAAPPPLALSDDFFSMPAQPGSSMGGMQVRLALSCC